jgi:plasmid maintenance system killer protein
MIKSYKNVKTRRVHDTSLPRGFKGLDGNRAVRVLNLLDNAATLDELPRLAAYRPHKLSHARKGQWSMTINFPWVVCFEAAKGGGWTDVEIVDYH